jgi:hypothetical protein
MNERDIQDINKKIDELSIIVAKNNEQIINLNDNVSKNSKSLTWIFGISMMLIIAIITFTIYNSSELSAHEVKINQNIEDINNIKLYSADRQQVNNAFLVTILYIQKLTAVISNNPDDIKRIDAEYNLLLKQIIKDEAPKIQTRGVIIK